MYFQITHYRLLGSSVLSGNYLYTVPSIRGDRERVSLPKFQDTQLKTLGRVSPNLHALEYDIITPMACANDYDWWVYMR